MADHEFSDKKELRDFLKRTHGKTVRKVKCLNAPGGCTGHHYRIQSGYTRCDVCGRKGK